MKILVTGAAGFIGAAMTEALMKQKYEVVGVDNINSYYDTRLKYARLERLGIKQEAIRDNKMLISMDSSNLRFVKLDVTDRIAMGKLFQKEQFDLVLHLAAQAGVRYSLENPYAYVETNVLGFLNILENCRLNNVQHLVYASSSSVYGASDRIPYSEDDRADMPVSLYAATKRSDELMAHVYSHLYNLPTTGLRFFTVYGPWGRPDMAPFLFMKSILEGTRIQVFNHGKLSRDFTYIDDIVQGVMRVLNRPSVRKTPCRVFNIGNSSPVKLLDFIEVIEKVTGKQAIKEMTEMQPGDVFCTYADVFRLQREFDYKPSVGIEEGITRFYEWYKSFYKPEE